MGKGSDAQRKGDRRQVARSAAYAPPAWREPPLPAFVRIDSPIRANQPFFLGKATEYSMVTEPTDIRLNAAQSGGSITF